MVRKTAPTRLIADMFFNGDREETYYEIGVYSGNKSLATGLYGDLLEGVDKPTAAKFISQFYNIYFSEGALKTFETADTIVFEYHDQPDYALENPPRLVGYLETMLKIIQNPPYKIDW